MEDKDGSYLLAGGRHLSAGRRRQSSEGWHIEDKCGTYKLEGGTYHLRGGMSKIRVLQIGWRAAVSRRAAPTI